MAEKKKKELTPNEKAFVNARNQGKRTYTHDLGNGKTVEYSTRRADETEEDWGKTMDANAAKFSSKSTQSSSSNATKKTSATPKATANTSAPKTDYSNSIRDFQAYNGLDIDGKIGAKTMPKIKEFQKISGLVDDGVWGPKTEEAWKKSLHKNGTVDPKRERRAVPEYMKDKTKEFEGKISQNYDDTAPASSRLIPSQKPEGWKLRGTRTAGYGHTNPADINESTDGKVYDDATIDKWFDADVANVQDELDQYIQDHNLQLNDNQYGALLDLFFNMTSNGKRQFMANSKGNIDEMRKRLAYYATTNSKTGKKEKRLTDRANWRTEYWDDPVMRTVQPPVAASNVAVPQNDVAPQNGSFVQEAPKVVAEQPQEQKVVAPSAPVVEQQSTPVSAIPSTPDIDTLPEWTGKLLGYDQLNKKIFVSNVNGEPVYLGTNPWPSMTKQWSNWEHSHGNPDAINSTEVWVPENRHGRVDISKIYGPDDPRIPYEALKSYYDYYGKPMPEDVIAPTPKKSVNDIVEGDSSAVSKATQLGAGGFTSGLSGATATTAAPVTIEQRTNPNTEETKKEETTKNGGTNGEGGTNGNCGSKVETTTNTVPTEIIPETTFDEESNRPYNWREIFDIKNKIGELEDENNDAINSSSTRQKLSNIASAIASVANMAGVVNGAKPMNISTPSKYVSEKFASDRKLRESNIRDMKKRLDDELYRAKTASIKQESNDAKNEYYKTKLENDARRLQIRTDELEFKRNKWGDELGFKYDNLSANVQKWIDDRIAREIETERKIEGKIKTDAEKNKYKEYKYDVEARKNKLRAMSGNFEKYGNELLDMVIPASKKNGNGTYKRSSLSYEEKQQYDIIEELKMSGSTTKIRLFLEDMAERDDLSDEQKSWLEKYGIQAIKLEDYFPEEEKKEESIDLGSFKKKDSNSKLNEFN